MKFIVIELPFVVLSFGSLYLGILGLIYGGLQALCLFSLFASLKYFLESYSATTELLRKELNGH